MAPLSRLYCPMVLEEHDLKTVAQLLYLTAPELLTLYFGAQAIPLLMHLIRGTESCFSHRYLRVAVDHNQVAGVASVIPAIDLQTKQGDYDHLLSRVQWGRRKIVQKFIAPLVLKMEYPPDSYYLGNLAVAAEFRRRGIGRGLLQACIAEVAAVSQTLFISVDVQKTMVQEFYQSLGFQEVERRVIHLFGFKLGSLVLKLPINDSDHEPE